MPIEESLLEIGDYTRPGYSPVIDFEGWRVALLNYTDELRAENITRMQRHNETDEVFVLLKGRCILFLGHGADTVTQVYAEDMQPCKIYNVKKSAWHSHTLDKEAMVLIVENRDTTYDNSPFYSLSETQRQEILDLTAALWISGS
jgi:hypothetical protein